MFFHLYNYSETGVAKEDIYEPKRPDWGYVVKGEGGLLVQHCNLEEIRYIHVVEVR